MELAWRVRAINRRKLQDRMFAASLAGREIEGAEAMLRSMEPDGDQPVVETLNEAQRSAMAEARRRALERVRDRQLAEGPSSG